jgi:mono/diheme cytochrome c family protein
MKFFERGALAGAIVLMFMFIGSLAAEGKGDPIKGKEVFRVTACWRCHDIDQGITKRGPTLKGVFQRPPHKLADGTQHDTHTDAMFRDIITNGTVAMNPRGAVLTDEELDDLLAYLHTL